MARIPVEMRFALGIVGISLYLTPVVLSEARLLSESQALVFASSLFVITTLIAVLGTYSLSKRNQ